MNLAIDMFVERAAPGAVRGDHWRVSWFDRELGKFVGGAGPNAWSALAWAVVNRIETARGMIVIARNDNETPAARLAVLLATPLEAPREVPVLTPVAASVDDAKPETPPEPPIPASTRSGVAFSLTPVEAPTKKSAAARRAATKKPRTK